MHRTPALFGLLLLASPAVADDETAAVACVRAKVWEAYAEGWGLRTIASAGLSLNERATWKVTLYPGRTYRFHGCGDDATQHLDLLLYDGNGQPVKRDETEDGKPVFDYKSDKIGAFYLVAHTRRVADPDKPVEVAIAVTHRN